MSILIMTGRKEPASGKAGKGPGAGAGKPGGRTALYPAAGPLYGGLPGLLC